MSAPLAAFECADRVYRQARDRRQFFPCEARRFAKRFESRAE